MQTSERAHRDRILRYVAVIALIELGLFAIGYFAPAMRTLLGPVYLIVPLLFVIPIWHASRTRGPGHDRRRSDRRG